MARERLSIREVLADGTVITRRHYSVQQPSDTPRPSDARSDPPRNDMPTTRISIDTFGVGDTSQDIIVIFDSTPARQTGRRRDASSQRARVSADPGRTFQGERSHRIVPPSMTASQSRYTSHSGLSRASGAPLPLDYPLTSEQPPVQHIPRQSAGPRQYSVGTSVPMRPPRTPTQHSYDHVTEPEASREREQQRRSVMNPTVSPQVSSLLDELARTGSFQRKRPVQETTFKPHTPLEGGTSCASRQRIRSADYRNIRAPTVLASGFNENDAASEYPIPPKQPLHGGDSDLAAVRMYEDAAGHIGSLPSKVHHTHGRDRLYSEQTDLSSPPLISQPLSRATTHQPSEAPCPAHRGHGSFQATPTAQGGAHRHRPRQHRTEACVSEPSRRSLNDPSEAHPRGRVEARTRGDDVEHRDRHTYHAHPDTEVSYGTTPFYQADLPTSPPIAAAATGGLLSQGAHGDFGTDGGKYVRSPKTSHAENTKYIRPPKTSYEDMRGVMLPPVLVARQVPNIASYLPESSSIVYGGSRSDQDQDGNTSSRDRSADVLVRKRRQNESIRQRGQDDSLRQDHKHETEPASRREEATHDHHSDEAIGRNHEGPSRWNGHEEGNHAEESIQRSDAYSHRPYREADDRDTTSSSSGEVSGRDTARYRAPSPWRPRKKWPRDATPIPGRETSRSRFASRNRSASSSSGKLASSSDEEAQETVADSNVTRTVRTIPLSEEPTLTAFAEIRPQSGDCEGKSHRSDSKRTNVWHLIRTSSGPSSKVGFRDKPAKPMCLPCFDDKYTSRKVSNGQSSRSKSRTRSRSRVARRRRSRSERDGEDEYSERHRAK